LIFSVAVLLFADHQPRSQLGSLAGLPSYRVAGPADIDAAIGPYRRFAVVGADADLAAVLARLLRAERLDIEVAYVPRRRTAATRVYRLPAGRRAARRSKSGSARRASLIRDETGSVIVGQADWLPDPSSSDRLLHGEAIVDDNPLFDGDVAGVCIEPTSAPPGLRARVHGRRRWITGRAVQLGSTGVVVVRDGLSAPRSARRSTFYRHIEGWLLVR
jgi:hypothetical protein